MGLGACYLHMSGFEFVEHGADMGFADASLATGKVDTKEQGGTSAAAFQAVGEGVIVDGGLFHKSFDG